jgi:BioD-like phosphotransacetylase family protein
MKSLYIASTSSHSGKSLVSLALGLRMKSDGLKVGYIKPIGVLPTTVDGIPTDEDAFFIAQALAKASASEESDIPVDLLCPVLMDPQLGKATLGSAEESLKEKILSAFSKISAGKDMVIVGGVGSLSAGSLLDLSGPKLADLMNAKMLLVIKYESDYDVEDLILFSQLLKPRIAGSILNYVPKEQMEHIQGAIIPHLKEKDIPVIGAIPEDEILGSITPKELADGLGGKILCCDDKMDELVQHFIIGAMDVRSASRYFREMHDKAVITGGDRPDIQLAALQTSTKCLILTGNLHPSPVIVDRARQVSVPIILVMDDTLTTVEKMEDVLGSMRVRESKKIERAKELFEQNVDLDKLYSILDT